MSAVPVSSMTTRSQSKSLRNLPTKRPVKNVTIRSVDPNNRIVSISPVVPIVPVIPQIRPLSSIGSNLVSNPGSNLVQNALLNSEEYKNVLECTFCLYSFSNEFPHYHCMKMYQYNNNPCNLKVCQACFIRWIGGYIKADNVGFRQIQCRCGNDVEFSTVKQIFPAEDFVKYDAALTKFVLEKDKSIIYCPGKDCPNAFIKPKLKKAKRQCRKTTCDCCNTDLCCLCGELYTDEHAKMKCGLYKKWKQTNDEDTISLKRFIQNQTKTGNVKPCPSCKRNVEKTGGCNDMRCTNCNTRFCWVCTSIKTEMSCETCRKMVTTF